MKIRSRLLWKLSAVVVAIMAGAILLAGYVTNLICAHYSLQSARASLRFNSESIVKGIGQHMMSRNNQGIEELIGEISRNSEVYRDIRLVSHYSGQVVAARYADDGEQLQSTDRACAVCHDRSDLDTTDATTVDLVVSLPEGGRGLTVMAPILNEARCSGAACHAHADSPPILGFINADYALDRIDAAVTERRVLIGVAVFGSLTLGTIALWFMFTRLLGRPIGELIAGTKRIAANQLDFRFEQKRDDEIGVLEQSLNTMTARIQAHRDELRSAMEYLGGIVESSADIIITVTPDGYIETFNRGAEEALGYSRIEVIGRRIETLFADPHERDVAIAQLRDTDNVKSYETRFLAKDGQARNVLLTLSRLRDRHGQPIGTFGISKDITQEKKLQRELLQSQKLAAIGQVVTGIQHAIKNLLNGLKGGAYLVRGGMAKADEQQVQEGCAMVEEGVARISDLAHHMLNYAKEWALELQKDDLNELVAKICESNRQAAVEQGVAIDFQAPDGLPAVVCDPKLIHMAATDILVNAIDACTWKDYGSGESPEVAARNFLTERGDFFVIEIRDNGCGMNEEIKRDIFTPFFSTKNTRGAGLGLALTARIIAMHGGEVTVESEPERGATFRIHLPVDGPPNQQEAADG